MPIDYAALQQAELDQDLEGIRAEQEKSPGLGDLARSFGIGMANLPVAAGAGLNLLGLNTVGRGIQDWAEGIQNRLFENMSVAGQAASRAPIFNTGEDAVAGDIFGPTPIASTFMKGAATLPDLAAIAVPGMAAVKGLGALGKAAGIARLAPELGAAEEVAAATTAARRAGQMPSPFIGAPSKLAQGLGFGAAEGIYSGLENAGQVDTELRDPERTPIEKLRENPLFQKRRAELLDPNLTEDAKDQIAREETGRDAGMDVLWKTSLTTGGISGLFGGGVLGQLVRPVRGFRAGAVHGLLSEGATEALQSPIEQIHQNVALNQPWSTDTLAAGLEGGLLGGLLGGTVGGLHGALNRAPLALPAPLAVETAAPVEEQAPLDIGGGLPPFKPEFEMPVSAPRVWGDNEAYPPFDISQLPPGNEPLIPGQPGQGVFPPLPEERGIGSEPSAGVSPLPELDPSAPPLFPVIARASPLGPPIYPIPGTERVAPSGGVTSPLAPHVRIGEGTLPALEQAKADEAAKPDAKPSWFNFGYAAKEALNAPAHADIKAVWQAAQIFRGVDGKFRRVKPDYLSDWHEGAGVAPEIGAQFDAHGIAKSNPLGALLNLLANGVAPNHEFHTAPLGEAYKDGPFIVLGAHGSDIKTSGIHTVLVADSVAKVIPVLAKAYPKVLFVPYSQAGKALTAQAATPAAVATPLEPAKQEVEKVLAMKPASAVAPAKLGASNLVIAQLRAGHPVVVQRKATRNIAKSTPYVRMRTDEKGVTSIVGAFDFKINQWVGEAPEAVKPPIVFDEKTGEPRSADPKLPKSFQGKTAAEYAGLRETAEKKFKPATVARLDRHFTEELAPAAAAHAAATPPIVAVSAAAAPATQTAAATVPSVVVPKAKAVPQGVVTTSLQTPEAPIAARVPPEHRVQYQAARKVLTDAGMRADIADGVLNKHYDWGGQDGFDLRGIEKDLRQFQKTERAAAKAKVGRPTKEASEEQTLADRVKAVPDSVFSDPDPQIRQVARDLVSDPKQLDRLMPKLLGQQQVPRVERMKKAIAELQHALGHPTALVDTPAETGPNYTLDPDERAQWREYRAELIALALKPAQVEALLKASYVEGVGFDPGLVPRLRQAAKEAEGGADIRFSRGLRLRANALKVQQIQGIVDQLVSKWKRPPFGGIRVHARIETLPPHLLKQLYDDGAHLGDEPAQAIYDGVSKTVHLLAPHLATPEEAQFVIFHEVLGHFGLRGFLKEDFPGTMRELYRTNAILRQAANALMKEFSYSREEATEEALADFAATGVPIQGVSVLMAKLRRALRAIGLTSAADWLESRSDAREILNVLAQARSFVVEGKGSAAHVYTAANARAMYSYGGVNAARANLTARDAAEDFEAAGVSKEQIRAVTGWHKGEDGKWKFEIDDSQAALKEGWRNATTVGELLSHSKLFDQYPLLANTNVEFRFLGSAYAGYDHKTQTLLLSDALDPWPGEPRNKNDQLILSSTLHELQHVVQHAEDFAQGGSSKNPEIIEMARRELGLFEIQEHLSRLEAERDVHIRASTTLTPASDFYPNAIRSRVAAWKAAYPQKARTLKNLQTALEEKREAVEQRAQEIYESLAGEREARDVQARLLLTPEERTVKAPYSFGPMFSKSLIRRGRNFSESDVRYSRGLASGTDRLASYVGAFFNYSAPFKRAFGNFATFKSKAGAARAIKLALARSINSPHHLATSGRSQGYGHVFGILRNQQQFVAYMWAHIRGPIAKTWGRARGIFRIDADYEAAAKALHDHNDRFGHPEKELTQAQFLATQRLSQTQRALYLDGRAMIRRALMAEHTAKMVRAREVILDQAKYDAFVKDNFDKVQQRIDKGFIPNRHYGNYAVGAYYTATKPDGTAFRKYLHWSTYESIGEAQRDAPRLRAEFASQPNIKLDIDDPGRNGQPSTVERSQGDMYSRTAFWDFLEQAKQAGITLSREQQGELAKMMLDSESMQQNKIQERANVPGYSKDLSRVFGEIVASTGYAVADTYMSARVVGAMNKDFAITTKPSTDLLTGGVTQAETAELKDLKTHFQQFAAAAESVVYDQLTKDMETPGADLPAIFKELTDYARMKHLESAGKPHWDQDSVDAGVYHDHAANLIAFLKQPKASWATKFRVLAALHFLGGSISAALINFSTLPMASAPWLSQFTSYSNGVALLTKHFLNFARNFQLLLDPDRLKAALDPIARRQGDAAKDWESLRTFGADDQKSEAMLRAVQRAVEEGILTDSNIHELLGMTQGGLIAHSSAVQRGMSWWMWPFRTTEQANRFATFLAAYENATGGLNGKTLTSSELYNHARDGVDHTQLIYDPINRQPWARTPLGHALFTFRAFPLMLGELFARMPAKQRTIMLGTLFLMAGLEGMPFADDANDILETVSQRLFNKPWNPRRGLTNMLASASEAMLGVDLSGLVTKGVLDSVFGSAVSPRLGFQNLVPGSALLLQGKDQINRSMADIMGPIGSEAGSFIGALAGGPGAIGKALPTALRNVGKAVESLQYGKLTDPKGQTLVNDVTAWETFMQGLGVTSGRLSQAYQHQRDVLQDQAFVASVRDDFLAEIKLGAAHNDPSAIAEVGKKQAAWNAANPENPIKFDRGDLRRSLALAGMSLSERTAKLLQRHH